jgi:hypothetical protein
VDPADHRVTRPTGTPQLDPAQALRSIQQIEHGVARALDEIHSDRERDRGTAHDDRHQQR